MLSASELIWTIGAFSGVFIMMVNKSSSESNNSYNIQMLGLLLWSIATLVWAFHIIFIRFLGYKIIY